MYRLPFAWLRSNSFSLVITGLAALAMCGCPPTGGPIDNGNDNEPLPECGDGVVDTSEPCDDGNTEDGDGCSSTCELERLEPPRCGNGVVTGSEQCDDGNTEDGDGCSSTCQNETPEPPARCGDGVVNGTEQCDGGGETQTCNANCTNTRCGDGLVNLHAGEQCDDGNTVDGDLCSSICHDEPPIPPECGDGVVNETEQCDGGGSETATCNINCTTSRCGDAIVNTLAGEQCDDGNTNPGDACGATCLTETGGGGGGGGGGPRCGDGVKNGTEQCDTGGQSATCNSNCTTPRCGDGILNNAANEQCDDGNTANGDGCSSTCQSEPGGPLCGNGVVEGTEECDDGGESASCNPNCTTSQCGDGIRNATAGEQCDDGGESASCNSNCRTSQCGDRILNVTAGEQCDDGNTNAGDGCGATCQNEVSVIPNDDCDAAIAVGDGTRTYSTVGATTDGSDEPATCDFSGETNVESDIWYCYTASCTGTALVSLCGSDYDTKLAVYDGCGCPTAAPLACSDDDCGTGEGNFQSRVEFSATAGLSYLVRVGGYLGEQGDGRLTIGCNVDACGGGSGDCFAASPTEAPGCGDAVCCEEVCALDQFCCDVTWDEACAGEASGLCIGGGGFPACGATNPRSCDTSGTTPGCDNEACCNTVCTVDPYCCLVVWDDVCVDEANSMCFLTCGAGRGDCHSAHTTPGCESQTCCEAVCAADSFCCESAWDQTCVDTAAAECP